ncbi:ArsR/SmtB family transcription factor [Calorimonas adulescens]|uniref:Winged helix-turn-helix transcriptional regulator n=1 Tax=Calorimonas adulescens TaxID=2606906 RepID=A0A5D8Q7U1_9THEO|nr:metalloregulator ArsR/SmtB family transcription factor [Calorimonas adulescens]TZE80700.1 winged helix-turn-helix transcriptional regulator [Calorimonas adulescens]
MERSDVYNGLKERETSSIDELKPQIKSLKGISEVFKALSDDSRSKIIYMLSKKELCVGDIAYILDMNLQAVSYHLKMLKSQDIIKSRRDGKMIYYSLADDYISNLIELVAQYRLGV